MNRNENIVRYMGIFKKNKKKCLNKIEGVNEKHIKIIFRI